MIIKTKFDLGQKVWFKPEVGEPYFSRIQNITIDVDPKSGITIEYWTKNQSGVIMFFDESETFATKEEEMK